MAICIFMSHLLTPLEVSLISYKQILSRSRTLPEPKVLIIEGFESLGSYSTAPQIQHKHSKKFIHIHMESLYKGNSTDQESSPLGIEKIKIGTRKINLGN